MCESNMPRYKEQMIREMGQGHEELYNCKHNVLITDVEDMKEVIFNIKKVTHMEPSVCSNHLSSESISSANKFCFTFTSL